MVRGKRDGERDESDRQIDGAGQTDRVKSYLLLFVCLQSKLYIIIVMNP